MSRRPFQFSCLLLLSVAAPGMFLVISVCCIKHRITLYHRIILADFPMLQFYHVFSFLHAKLRIKKISLGEVWNSYKNLDIEELENDYAQYFFRTQVRLYECITKFHSPNFHSKTIKCIHQFSSRSGVWTPDFPIHKQTHYQLS